MKKTTLSGILYAFIIFLLSFTFILSNSQTSIASEEKDLILILDTSLSMVGYGGKNILPQVKQSLPKYIEQLEEDDSVTFITFDTEVKVYPTIYISDEKNKESLVEYMKDVQATGKWTYTKEMMKVALKKADELEQKSKKRQRVLVVMTDAIDDPPPDQRGSRLDIRDIAKNYKDKDWFIFFINFGNAKNNEKLNKIKEELKTSVTKYTEVLETEGKKGKAGREGTAGGGIASTIERDLSENIEKMTVKRIEREGSFPFIPLLIALLVIAVVLLLLYYFRNYSKLKVTGKLEYWDHTLLSPYFENFDLTRQDKKEILIGKKGAFDLTIREIEIIDPLRITATRVDGEIKNTLQAGKGYNIEYVNRETGGYLKNGDIFRVANYSFKYTSV